MWGIILLVVSLLGAILYINHQKTVISQYKTEIHVKDLVIDQKEKEINNLVVSIQKQNEAIDELSKATQRVEGNLQQVKKVNEELAKKTNARIAEFMSEVVPKDCEGAMTNLKSFVGKTAKEWNKK